MLPEMHAKATGDDGGDLPFEGRTWGKNRPAGTISREGMRARVARQIVAVHLFAQNKTACSVPITVWLLQNSF